jgi:hypothetical protein
MPIASTRFPQRQLLLTAVENFPSKSPALTYYKELSGFPCNISRHDMSKTRVLESRRRLRAFGEPFDSVAALLFRHVRRLFIQKHAVPLVSHFRKRGLGKLALEVQENPSSEPEKVPVAVAGRNSPSKFAGSVGSEDVGPWWCTSPEAVHVMWMLTVPGTPPGAKN